MPPARPSLVSPLLQYLSLLLAAPDAAVVLATLQTLAAFVRKSGSPTTRRVTMLAPSASAGQHAAPAASLERPFFAHVWGVLRPALAPAHAMLSWLLIRNVLCCLPSGCCRACRWSGTEDLNARLMALAGSWGSGDDAPDLVACARPGTQHIPQVRWGRQAACLPAFLPACLPAC